MSHNDMTDYQDDNKGMYPNAPGAFSDKKIGGLRIYVPKRKDEENAETSA